MNRVVREIWRRITARLLILLVMMLAFCVDAYGTDISFTAGVDRTEIGLDEQITLELTVAGDAQNLPEPSPPQISGFQVYGAGTSQQISFANGAVQATVSHRYVIVPQHAGEFVIPPQEIVYEGQRYLTEPITITVKSTPTPAQRPSRPSDQPSPDRSTSDRQTDDYIAQTLVDKDTAYVNEQVTLTFRLYHSRPLHTSPDYTPATATGFWVEDLPPQKNFSKTIDGKIYNVIEVKRALFPTAPGEKAIGKATLNIKQDDVFSIFDRDPFGFFDRRRHSNKPVYLETEPIEVVVLPLPAEGKPADFSGSVGKFKMSTSIDKTQVEVNQPVTVKIKISGQGNIKTLPEPQIPELDNFRVFSAGKSENVSKAGYVVGGSRTFELTFVPKEAGEFTIPAISSNYFDPEEGTYKRLSGKAYQISVGGVSNEEIAAHNGLPSGRFPLAAKDIRYIITDGTGTESTGGLYLSSPAYLLLNVLPLVAVVVIFAVRRRKDKLAGDIRYRRLKRAVKMAKMRLARADGYLRSGQTDDFYTELSRALNEYIGDKFNVSAQGLTAQQTEQMFAERNAPEDLREKYWEVISTCDQGRFAASTSDNSDMSKVLNMAEEWIVRFEGKVK